MSKLLHLAHLINPFRAPESSEFSYVQPITFASMLTAQQTASPSVKVDLFTAQFSEDHGILPHDFHITPDLSRSVRDLGYPQEVPSFPLISDLIDRLFEATKAEYLIYTNVDIALQPDFYLRVAAYIQSGHQALIINRRRISGHYRSTAELPTMYAQTGKSHPGFDCFVFRRDIYPKFKLANVCIGIPFIGILLAQNVFAYGKNFQLLDQEHMTFHIGKDVYKKRNPVLFAHNQKEFWQAIDALWPDLHTQKWPWGHWWLPARLIRWGLHPSIPIRLALKLEMRQLRLRK